MPQGYISYLVQAHPIGALTSDRASLLVVEDNIFVALQRISDFADEHPCCRFSIDPGAGVFSVLVDGDSFEGAHIGQDVAEELRRQIIDRDWIAAKHLLRHGR